MENQENKFVSFTQKYGQYVVAAIALIAFGFLFLPLLKVDFGDGVNKLNLIGYVGSVSSLGWILIVGAAHLVIGTYSLIFAVVIISLTRKFYKLGLPEDIDASVKLAYGTYLSVSFAALAALLSLSLAYSKEKMTVRDIAEEGMLIALAFVLNLITFYKAPSGGSVNLQMLPLFVLAIRHGPTHGFIASAIIYGFLTLVTDGYTIACYPFDYLIAFGGITVLGALKPLIFNKYLDTDKKTQGIILGLSMILAGGIIATAIRYVGSTMSSVIVWEYSLVEGLIYNASYIPLSGALATAAAMALYPLLISINKRFPVKHSYLY